MPVPPPPLVGRTAVLAQVCRSARNRRGTVLTGARGAGGSRLLEEAFRTLRRSGTRVARLSPGSPGNGARVDPFLALLDRATIAALPAGDRGALRSAVLALQPDVLLIDDAHLLDAVAGALTTDLVRAGVAIVANATGPGGMPDALRRIVAEGGADTIPLPPLTPAEVTELAGLVLGDPVDAILGDALLTASGGRPGALTELVEDAVSTGSIARGDGLWRLVGPLPVARSVRTAVAEAFATLPADQRGWIAAVATAGSIAADLSPRIAAADAIAAAEALGWTARDPASGRTGIPSLPLRTAVLASLDPGAGKAVLRRLVSVAETADRPLVDDERVALLRWRLELGLQVDAAEAFALATLPATDDASREQLLRAAVAGGAPAGAALADHLRHTRRASEALELIGSTLPGAASDAERISLIRVASLTAGVVERRSREALTALDTHLAQIGPHRDLLAVRAALLLLEGRPREAVEVAEVVLQQGENAGFAPAFAQLQQAFGSRELGSLERSVAAAERYAGMCGPHGAFPQAAALARWLRAEVAVAVGMELDEAEAALTAEYDRIPPQLRATERAPIAYTLATVRLHRGDPGSAVRLLREADAGSGPWREGWQPRLLAELTVAQALSGAVGQAAATYDRLLRTTCPPVQRCRVELAAAQLAHAGGDRERAAAVAAAAAEQGRRTGLVLDEFDAWFAALRYGHGDAAERLLALGSLPAGTGRDAQRAYAAAVVQCDPGAVSAAATGLWQAGLRLHAVEAAARAADLGAPDAPQQLVAWLARLPGLRLPGIRSARGGGLTAREREVAVLAAEGASDRAIAEALGITLRTAQTHLGRALAKLGVHRRTELRRLIGDP